MWTCSKCATKVDPGFDVCWACGTTSEGVEDPTFVPAGSEIPDPSPLVVAAPAGVAPFGSTDSEGAELVEAYWAIDLMQAKFLADRLNEEGIPAVSDTHDLHDALGSMRSGPKVWVRADDLPRAKAWLDAYDEQFQQEHGGAERD